MSNRWQRVKINNSFSSWQRVVSGVPQGSVLGPLLFLIYINDLPNIVLYACARLYADDSKLSKVYSKSVNFSHQLQQDLFIFEEWAAMWQLKVNVNKCSVMKFGRNRPDVSYSLNNSLLPIVDNVRDLGVIISNNLTFSTHISTIVSKASSKIGLMYRAFSSRDIFMVSFFKTHVRPILEYNCEV